MTQQAMADPITRSADRRGTRRCVAVAAVCLALVGPSVVVALAATNVLYINRYVGGDGFYQCSGGSGTFTQTGPAYRDYNDVYGPVGWLRGSYYLTSTNCSLRTGPGHSSTTEQPVHDTAWNSAVAGLQNTTGSTLIMYAYTTTP